MSSSETAVRTSLDVPLGPEHFDEPIFAHLRRDYVPIGVDLTVGEALAHLRSQQLGQTIVYFYVVSADGRLQGIVPTRRLLMSDPSAPIASIMATNVVTMPTWATVRDACDMFMMHRFLAFPVGPIVLALADLATLLFYFNIAGVLLS